MDHKSFTAPCPGTWQPLPQTPGREELSNHWEPWTTGDGARQGTRPPMGPAQGLPVGILPGSPRMLKCQHRLQQGHENQGERGDNASVA